MTRQASSSLARSRCSSVLDVSCCASGAERGVSEDCGSLSAIKFGFRRCYVPSNNSIRVSCCRAKPRNEAGDGYYRCRALRIFVLLWLIRTQFQPSFREGEHATAQLPDARRTEGVPPWGFTGGGAGSVRGAPGKLFTLRNGGPHSGRGLRSRGGRLSGICIGCP